MLPLCQISKREKHTYLGKVVKVGIALWLERLKQTTSCGLIAFLRFYAAYTHEARPGGI